MRGAAVNMDDSDLGSDLDDDEEMDIIVDPETLAKREAAFERDGKIDPEPGYGGGLLQPSFHGAADATPEQAAAQAAANADAEVEAEAVAADAAVAAAQAAARVAEAAAAATALSVESVAAAQRSQRSTKDK